jgi:hypothetical protein
MKNTVDSAPVFLGYYVPLKRGDSMAIKVRLPDGTDVESDSPRELVEFLQLRGTLSNTNGTASSHTAKVAKPSFPAVTSVADEMSENAAKLVTLLIDHPDGVETRKLAESLGVDVKGLGGYVTSFTNWSKRNGLGDKRTLLVKLRATKNGVKSRSLSLSKRFYQLVKEGRIPGF